MKREDCKRKLLLFWNFSCMLSIRETINFFHMDVTCFQRSDDYVNVKFMEF